MYVCFDTKQYVRIHDENKRYNCVYQCIYVVISRFLKHAFWMYIYTYKHICTYKHIYTYIYIYIYIYMYTCYASAIQTLNNAVGVYYDTQILMNTCYASVTQSLNAAGVYFPAQATGNILNAFVRYVYVDICVCVCVLYMCMCISI